MAGQIWKLTALQLCNLFDLNEFRHTNDKKKKRRYLALGIVWIFLLLMLLFYVTITDVSYIVLGMPEMIPLISAVLIGTVVLFFGMFKAGSIIFQMKGYEMLCALPVSKTAIIVSRFLYMYTTNLAMSVLVMLPGIVTYGISQRADLSFYLLSVIGMVLMPLLPMTIAVMIGAVITGISSRMKHKSLVSAGLSLIVLTLVLILSMQSGKLEGTIDEEMVRNMSSLLMEQMRGIYPPAAWFTAGVTERALDEYVLFVVLSVGIFVLMVAVLSRFFSQICTALQSHESGKAADISKLQTSTVVKALYKKEWKHYLSSSIYVVNTAMGDIMMVILGAAIFFAGIEKVETLLQMSGIIGKTLPFLLAAMPSIMSTTACAISIEGKEWWMAKSIPVRTKDILDSKILVNLTMALPCYAIAEMFVCLAVRTTLAGYLCLIFVPFVYIFFISVAGLSINLAFPVFDWENETAVVKQGAAVMLTMLCGMIAAGIPLLLCFLLPKDVQTLLCVAVMVVLLGITAVLYRRSSRLDLRSI